MTEDEKKDQARRFLSLLGNPNEDVLRSVAVEDVTWTFPGTSPISGEACGIADVMKRASTIAAHGVRVENHQGGSRLKRCCNGSAQHRFARRPRSR